MTDEPPFIPLCERHPDCLFQGGCDCKRQQIRERANEPPSDCANPNCRDPRPHEHYAVPDPENEGNWITATRAIGPPSISEFFDDPHMRFLATAVVIAAQLWHLEPDDPVKIDLLHSIVAYVNTQIQSAHPDQPDTQEGGSDEPRLVQ